VSLSLFLAFGSVDRVKKDLSTQSLDIIQSV